MGTIDLPGERPEVIARTFAGDQPGLFGERTGGRLKQSLQPAARLRDRHVIDGEDVPERQPLGAVGEADEGDFRAETAGLKFITATTPDQPLGVMLVGQHACQCLAIINRVFPGPRQHIVEREAPAGLRVSCSAQRPATIHGKNAEDSQPAA